ncbi:MAG: DUF1624 domain-containing protein [Ruminococcus sp.]|nr:DUF1624 domain-containing protein [Ruminococcus sp.]
MEKTRYTLPDALRGVAILEMIIYHALWDMVFIFDCDLEWFNTYGAYIWQQSICCTFILLSGFCVNFSRRKLKRSLIVLICSLIISIVTIIFFPYAAVKFGVLCLIGSGMLLMIPLDRLLKKAEPITAAVIFFCIFIFMKNIYNGFLGIGNIWTIEMPDMLYRNMITAYLGFPPDDFSSSDYFPVIPWMFLYITGYFIYRILKKYGLLHSLSKISLHPVEWIGRHSLIIYMLHQPIIYGVLWAIFQIV